VIAAAAKVVIGGTGLFRASLGRTTESGGIYIHLSTTLRTPYTPVLGQSANLEARSTGPWMSMKMDFTTLTLPFLFCCFFDKHTKKEKKKKILF
jgi:hypothetical protein